MVTLPWSPRAKDFAIVAAALFLTDPIRFFMMGVKSTPSGSVMSSISIEKGATGGLAGTVCPKAPAQVAAALESSGE